MEMEKKKIMAVVAEIRVPELPAGRMGRTFPPDRSLAVAARSLENQ